jgi:hypothetical protein
MAHFKPFKKLFFYLSFYSKLFASMFLVIHHILNPYNMSQIKNVHKNGCIERHLNKKSNHIFQFQLFYYIFGAYMLYFEYIIIIIKIIILNLITNLTNILFYGMFIAHKCMTFYKTLHYDAKNEPPYLTTTFQSSNFFL